MTTKAKADDDKPKTRLFDIRVHEVSLVDRAANRRRFLLAKRDDGMKTRLVADGKGGFVEVPVEKSEGASSDDSTDAKTDDGQNMDTDGKPSATAKGEGDGDTDDAKAGGDKSKPTAKAMLAAVAERVIEVAKKLDDGESIPDTFDDEIASMVGEVMKAARMTPSRKGRFEKALEELSKILGELAGMGDDEKGDKTKKSEADDGRLAKLTEQIEKLTSMVAKQAKTIEALESAPVGSNALRVESTERGASDDADVAWPMDMNEEAKVDKAAAQRRGVSFYD